VLDEITYGHAIEPIKRREDHGDDKLLEPFQQLSGTSPQSLNLSWLGISASSPPYPALVIYEIHVANIFIPEANVLSNVTIIITRQ
jgi:hypothetical protein